MKISEIKSFVEKIKTRKSNTKEVLVIGALSKEASEKIKKYTGIDLTGYTRIIDNYGVVHAFNQHGSQKIEEKRGQIAITPDDFENISKIIENPDEITSAGKNKIGRDLILNQKEIDNLFFYVEEIRTKHKELAMQTFYIRKKPLKK